MSAKLITIGARTMISSIFSLAFIGLCLQAAAKDVRTLTIPNWMNISIAALFLPAALVGGLGLSLTGWHLLAGLIAFVVSFGLFAVGAYGGGDAKMIPAVILWMGPEGILPFLFGMALAGGLLSIVLVLARKAVPADIAPGFARSVLASDAGIPYGVAIAAGAIYALPHSPLFTEFLSRFSQFG